MTKLFFGIRLRDIDCDFRLMRRSIFDKVSLRSNSGTICVEMVKKIEASGFTIREVPVHHFYRSYGKSQYFTFRRLLRTVIDLSKLWYELFISQPPSLPRSSTTLIICPRNHPSRETQQRRVNAIAPWPSSAVDGSHTFDGPSVPRLWPSAAEPCNLTNTEKCMPWRKIFGGTGACFVSPNRFWDSIFSPAVTSVFWMRVVERARCWWNWRPIALRPPVGFDFSAEAVKFLRLRGVANVLQASTTDIPFRSATFDLVTSFDVLCQLPAKATGKRCASSIAC